MALLSYQRILPQYLIWKILMEMAIKEVIWYIDYSSTNQLYNQEMDNDIIRSGVTILI